MTGPTLPSGLVEARRTPMFTAESVPPALIASHRTTVWAELHVEAGCVRFVELDGPHPRDVSVDAGRSTVIVPDTHHRIEPSTDAAFFVRFYRQP